MTFPTPYDGSSKLFQIGTRPLDPYDWLDPDDQVTRQLAVKDHLVTERRDEVFGERAASRPAQAELLALLQDYLPQRFPALWSPKAAGMRRPDGLIISSDSGSPPLLTAASMVQDDLLILERDPEAWVLTAASLCFPSSWQLHDKLGQRLDAIHSPVPGFGPGTRPAQIMARMFDAMRPETPMIRWNFSLYGDDRLFHPDVVGPGVRRFGEGERADPVFIRVERQTLRKLPNTGAIAFTIRISIDPISRIRTHEDGRTIAMALIEQVETLTEQQLEYKGLTLERGRLIERIRTLFSA